MSTEPTVRTPTEADVIADELRRAWNGDPWHGAALRQILDGVTAEQAFARPLPDAHSIGELVLHLAAWTGEAARRLRDGVARDPEPGDWPPFLGGDDAWRNAREALEGAQAELEACLYAFPSDELSATIGDERDRPLGAGVSYTVMLHGIAQHHAYHAGQIAMLKKGLG